MDTLSRLVAGHVIKSTQALTLVQDYFHGVQRRCCLLRDRIWVLLYLVC